MTDIQDPVMKVNYTLNTIRPSYPTLADGKFQIAIDKNEIDVFFVHNKIEYELKLPKSYVEQDGDGAYFVQVDHWLKSIEEMLDEPA